MTPEEQILEVVTNEATIKGFLERNTSTEFKVNDNCGCVLHALILERLDIDALILYDKIIWDDHLIFIGSTIAKEVQIAFSEAAQDKYGYEEGSTGDQYDEDGEPVVLDGFECLEALKGVIA